MRAPIELCNADLTKSTFKNIMFFSFAEGGAMGEAGGILFFVKSGELYHLNYVFGDADLKKVEELFPTLKECRFGMFGIDSSVPEGWRYVNLGMGNHLIVKDEVYLSFEEQLGGIKEPHLVYGKWIEAADKVIRNEKRY